ncbi:unnamed protein product [Aureobasidium uvarum]|uniref:Uncharacterized protein n=1 Tax=Aureobasidium uvarum TaxID=2773716 RepID=A0A9N8KXD7_9PEZI|nr:unnamed protein product [Aureobasidium uvarum]
MPSIPLLISIYSSSVSSLLDIPPRFHEMLARVKEILAGARRRTSPSVVLVPKRPNSTSLLHIVPETGDVEQIELTPPAFIYRGTTERSREQIATVSIYSAGHDINEYLVEVSDRATKILNGHGTPGPEGYSVLSIEQALRSAVFASLESRSSAPAKIGSQPFPLFLVQIDRSKPGKVLTHDDLTSFPK